MLASRLVHVQGQEAGAATNIVLELASRGADVNGVTGVEKERAKKKKRDEEERERKKEEQKREEEREKERDKKQRKNKKKREMEKRRDKRKKRSMTLCVGCDDILAYGTEVYMLSVFEIFMGAHSILGLQLLPPLIAICVDYLDLRYIPMYRQVSNRYIEYI